MEAAFLSSWLASRNGRLIRMASAVLAMDFFALRLFAFAGCLCLLAVPAVGQSQQDLNREAAEQFERVDRELNRVYRDAEAKLDAEGKAKLRAAQRAWIAFRDAEAARVADEEGRGGSIYPMIYAGMRKRLTEERVRQLQGNE